MTRLRELYGDRLRDPDWLLLLTVALATSTELSLTEPILKAS
jgi:hypothetical protein